MYAPFFGLKREPFSIAPDPRYLFMSERHREALAHLLYGVRAGGGFVLLTGEIGAGKTTVCRCFLEQIPKRCNVAYIFNPRLTVEELLGSICQEFGVPLPVTAEGVVAAVTVKDHLDPLNAFLMRTHAVGQNNVLIIDEAQQLSAEVLEQLRLLTNLETSERKLLQVILIGQPELREVLARPELEQLAQRVIARFHLEALSEDETAQYIGHRLSVAGLKRPVPFSDEALKLVHRLARGVPRRINLLCDRAMLGAYSAGQARIGRSVVRQAAAEVFDAPAESPVAAATRATRGWPRAAVLAAGVVMGAGLVGMVSWGLGMRADGAVAASESGTVAASAKAPASAALAASLPAQAGPAGSAATGAPPTPSASAAGSDRAAAGSAGASVATSGVAPSASAAAPPASAAMSFQAPPTLSSEDEAWRALAQRWQLGPDGDVCKLARQKLLACHRGRATLATLRQLDRPAVVRLFGRDDAAPRHAVLEGFGPQGVRLRVGAVAEELSALTFATQWRGDFATLWRPPPGFVEPQIEGRESPAAKWVAERLARVQRDLPEMITAAEAQASDPLARDAAFEARVRAFQRSQGLRADGVLGPVTLMQLNRAVGIDEPRLSAVR